MDYVLLAIAIVAEVIGTIALPLSRNFTKFGPSAVVVICYGVAFYLLSVVVQTIPVAIVYALWSGIGVALVTIASAIWLRQRIDVAGTYRCFLSKYTSSGDRIWLRQFGSLLGDSAGGVTTDRLGNVYLVSTLSNQIDVRQYSAAGDLLWTRDFAAGVINVSGGVAADALGNVYVTGNVQGSLAGNPYAGGNDVAIMKMDSSGNVLWTREIGSAGSDQSGQVSLDGLGYLYITGTTTGNLAGTNAGSDDAFVAKYDLNGNLIWIQQYGTTAPDVGYGVSADGLGNVFLAGMTRGALGGPNAGDYDAFVAAITVPEPSLPRLACTAFLTLLSLSRPRRMATG